MGIAPRVASEEGEMVAGRRAHGHLRADNGTDTCLPRLFLEAHRRGDVVVLRQRQSLHAMGRRRRDQILRLACPIQEAELRMRV